LIESGESAMPMATERETSMAEILLESSDDAAGVS
jgi:hypothetical protein